jgi:hypothetical protein
VRVVGGAGTATVERWGPGDILLRTDAPEGAVVVVRQFYYPLWGARADDQECCLQTQPSGPEGLLAVSVPAGSHEVQVYWRPGLAEYTGAVLSAVSLAGLLGLLGWSATRRPARGASEPGREAA